MKKRSLITVILLISLLFSLFGCKNEDKTEIKSLTVVEGSYEATYNVGDNVNFSSLEVLVKYKDGREETVGGSRLFVSGVDTSTPGKKQVVVSYGGAHTVIEITVIRLVEEIKIKNGGLKYNENWGNYTVLYLDGDKPLTYQIEYEVLPYDATYSEVRFIFDGSNTAEISGDGLITFSGEGLIKVKLASVDGSSVENTITVIAKKR